MKILFMGTPAFAVPSLKRLVADGHEICGVDVYKRQEKIRSGWLPRWIILCV